MSVFICDKARLPFSIYFLLDFTAHTRSIFKIFKVNELTKWFVFEARLLSGIKHELRVY